MESIEDKLYFQRFGNTLAMIDDESTVLTDEYNELEAKDLKAVWVFLYDNASILSGMAIREGIDEGFITFGNLN